MTIQNVRLIPEVTIVPNHPNEAEIARAAAALLVALGEDPGREGLRKTPQRVAQAWAEMLDGYLVDPLEYLQTTFAAEHDDLVIVRDLHFESVCEHHLLPFRGVAQIGYIPREGKVLGLSKLSRLLKGYAHRLQLQEKLTNQIADALNRGLNPQGVAVVLQAEHTCMSIRGVHQPNADTVTIAGRGLLAEPGASRLEFLQLIENPAIDGDDR